MHLAYCHLNIAQHNILVILYPACGGIIFQAQFKVIRQTELQSSEILKQKKQVLPAERDLTNAKTISLFNRNKLT